MSIKVLVADDSITIQKVIGIIFGGEEYSLTVVDNGKAAVDKAREINPDILLIDALMPGMTGYEVTEAVRSTPSLADKPILILTGSFEPFDEEKAKKCGADDFISKPFESQQIITKVKELLELGSSRALSKTSKPQPVPESISDQTAGMAAPTFDIPAPTFDQQPAAPQPAAPTDIWGAFTPEAESPAQTITAPVVAVPSSPPAEPDVFAIVAEESDAQLVPSGITGATSPSHTGSQWVPVEENTFEFEEEVIEEPPQTAFAEQPVPSLETSFGDISFDEDVTPLAAPVLSAIPEPSFSAPAPDFAVFSAPSPVIAETAVVEEAAARESVSVAEIAPLSAVSPTTGMTEEQLKAAITSASREVIERIVWEVVPDLAEALIREAIRKIKEGV